MSLVVNLDCQLDEIWSQHGISLQAGLCNLN